MAKITLFCGKICSGKSHIAKSYKGVPLSCDELMTRLFPEPLGDAYEAASARSKAYLLDLAETLASGGVDVVLDWGFWFREERAATLHRFTERGFDAELVYVEPTPERRAANIAARNAAVAAGDSSVYEADEGLLEKCDRLFEPPTEEVFTLIVNG